MRTSPASPIESPIARALLVTDDVFGSCPGVGVPPVSIVVELIREVLGDGLENDDVGVKEDLEVEVLGDRGEEDTEAGEPTRVEAPSTSAAVTVFDKYIEDVRVEIDIAVVVTIFTCEILK